MSPPYRGCFVYQSFRFNSLVVADIIRQNAGTTDRVPSRKHRKKRSGEPIQYLSFPSKFPLIDFYKPAIILLIVKPQRFQYSLLFSLGQHLSHHRRSLYTKVKSDCRYSLCSTAAIGMSHLWYKQPLTYRRFHNSPMLPIFSSHHYKVWVAGRG